MTTLFTRHGTEKALTHRDGKGRPMALEPRKCTRCGGAGYSDKWIHTGRVCYDCNGNGMHPRGPEPVRLYTAEELAKLDAAAEKRTAKRVAKIEAAAAVAKAEADARRAAFLAAHGTLLAKAEPYAARSEFVRDVVRKATERAEISDKAALALAAAIEKFAAEDARKAAAGYIGTIGERVRKLAVIVVNVAEFPSAYNRGTFRIVTLRTEAGDTVVVKSGSFYAEKGERLVITGTVREHGEYRGEKQTRLERVTIEAVAVAAEAAA